MILAVFCLIIILAVGYAQYRNGLQTSIVMGFQIFVAGLLAFNYFEPLADALEPSLSGGLAGIEDALAMTGVFCVALGLMRTVSNRLCPEMLNYDAQYQQFGGGFIGLISGYFLAGFLVCMLQTLPLRQDFLGFEPRREGEQGLRSLFPPDYVWLSLMRYAGAHAFSDRIDDRESTDPYEHYFTFDRDATFELRYLRYRRFTENNRAMPYTGEFDIEINKVRVAREKNR